MSARSGWEPNAITRVFRPKKIAVIFVDDYGYCLEVKVAFTSCLSGPFHQQQFRTTQLLSFGFEISNIAMLFVHCLVLDRWDYLVLQYENLRRVFKAVTATPGTTVKNIQSCFLLPDNLARYGLSTHLAVDLLVNNFILSRDYACALFMSVHLFELRTRRLLEYSFDDFVYCASEIMKGWTHRAPPVHQKPTEGVTSTSEGEDLQWRFEKL